MKYCPNCKILCEGEVCTECDGELKQITTEDWVLLAVDKEYELNTLCAYLSSADIEFKLDSGNVSAGSVSSRGFKNEAKLYVKFKNYEDAKEIAKLEGFHFPDDVSVTLITDDAKGRRPRKKQVYSVVAGQKNPEEISENKRKLGKAILYGSIVVVLIAGVILAEVIINAVKGLF